ncbi:MAG: NifU family protein, partial [Atribacterota bacterium]
MTKEKDTLKERVETALEKIKPALQADGGNVELVE